MSDTFDLRAYLKNNRLTENSSPSPSRPSTRPTPQVDPDVPPKPERRRRGTPNPLQVPSPAPKAMAENNDILKKIANRYEKFTDSLDEADYNSIFDPDTVSKLVGSVKDRIQNKNPMEIAMNLQKLSSEVLQLERGKESELSSLAKDIVYEAYPFLSAYSDTIEIDAEIVKQSQVKDELKPDNTQQEDIEDLDQEEREEILQDDEKKRRLINSITQGASTFSKTAHYLKRDYLEALTEPGTSEKYQNLMQSALDMIDIISQMPPSMMQGGSGGLEDSATGVVSVFYDYSKEKWIIKARAIVLPVLVLEIVKGMYEIISLFGFTDWRRGQKVVKNVDKIQNEPKDIAYGQLIARNLFDLIYSLDTDVTPEERDDLLQDIYKMDSKEFILLITNVINNKVTSSQKTTLSKQLTQMRQDKKADASNDALYELKLKDIKLLRIAEQVINEASIDQLQQQFVDTGKISQEDFDEIKDVTQKGAYATWLVKQVQNKNIKSEDIYKWKNYFISFDRRKREFPSNDINSYKTPQDISKFIAKAVEIKNQEEADPSKAKGVSKSDKYSNFKIGEIDGFTVYELPRGREDLYNASCELGSGTEWCTATGNTSSHFKSHIKDGPLFIFLNPKTGEKYQFHYETNQFKDRRDVDII